MREQPDPRPFLGSARDNRIKLLSDSRFEQKGSRGFANLAFDLVGRIFCFGAMSSQNIQLILTIGHRLAVQAAFNKRWVSRSG